MPELKRSTYIKFRDSVTLGKGKAATIWGYDPEGKFVCRLEMSNAGIAVYAGDKGGKVLCDATWEQFVRQLKS
jgi:hypothetical protein